MGRRSEHSREELQRLIIDATLSLVAEHGAGKVTARQIAAAVGYTPGMLYSVFLNLNEIFLHVNARSLIDLHEQCAIACTGSREPDVSIARMGQAYLDFAQNHTHQFDLLFRRRPPAQVDLPAVLATSIDSLFSLVEHELTALAPARTEQEVKLGARALWSGVHGAAELGLAGQLFLQQPGMEREVVGCLIQNFIASWKATVVSAPRKFEP